MPPLARLWVLEPRRRVLLPLLLASEVVAGLVNDRLWFKIGKRAAATTIGWTLDCKDHAPGAVAPNCLGLIDSLLVVVGNSDYRY